MCDPKAKSVTIKVHGNRAAARAFLSWLCESGEQQYWEYMEHRDGSEPVIGRFDYRFESLAVLGELTEDEQ